MPKPRTPKPNQPKTDARPVPAAEYERRAAERPGTYVLNLYVTGITPRSQRAIQSIRKLCEEHLPGGYELRVVDLYQQPGAAREQQIVAAPTLVKKLPLPLRKIIGDMSDPGRVLVALGLKVQEQ